MNPLQIQMFLNDINGNDDEEMVEDYIEQFMIQVNDGKSILEASRRWSEVTPLILLLSHGTRFQNYGKHLELNIMIGLKKEMGLLRCGLKIVIMYFPIFGGILVLTKTEDCLKVLLG